MSKFALLVTVRVTPGASGEFLPGLLDAAAAAVREEPDCLEFHVATDEDDPDTFVLYELYENAAGLEHHYQQPHFLEFREATGHLVVEKTRQRLEVH